MRGQRFVQVPAPTPTPADGFRAVPAENGGWVIQLPFGEPGTLIEPSAAFSNANDMLGWLASQLCFPIEAPPTGNQRGFTS